MLHEIPGFPGYYVSGNGRVFSGPLIYTYGTGLFSQQEIGSWHGVHQTLISSIITKKTWGHVWQQLASS